MKKDWKTTLPNHTGAIIIAALIVALLLIIASNAQMDVFRFQSPSDQEPVLQSNVPKLLPEVGDPGAEMLLSPIDLPNKTALSYAEAVTLYGDKRLQFVENCGILPTQVVHTQGSTVLLENRAQSGVLIAIAGNRYALPARSFIPIDFPYKGVFPAECNGIPNITTLYIQ